MKGSDIITFYILRLLKKYLSSLNARKRYTLSAKIGSMLYQYLYLRKSQARRNIKQAFPKLKSHEIEKILKMTYLNFCHNFIEFVSFPKSWKGIKIDIKGEKILRSLLNKKKGVIFITGHFGSWEMLGQWVGKNVPLFVGIAQKQKNKGAHIFFINQRELAGTKHILRGSPIKLMYDVLSYNGLLGLVSDQDAKKRGVFVDFFGVPASTPKGAALFNINTQAPILLGVCYKKNFKKYNIHFELINTTNKNVKEITQDYTHKLEYYIKKYPDQYFWFHRRWKTRPS
tara:strand:+ start:1718 stop:2572 length:855 start_codon:yes stop_codon:yes gene_type:complete